MTDVDLLVFGCAMTFITAAGFYVYTRARYENDSASEPQPVPIPSPARAEAPYRESA